MSIKVSTSILSANFGRLEEEINLLNQTSTDYLHIDIMDGVFVPNVSFGQPVLKYIKKLSEKPLDTHLMIVNPEKYIDDFVALDSEIITFHLEAVTHADRLVQYIKSCGVKVGVAINPSTSPINLEYLIEKIDLVLIMTVNPGFGGQKFIFNQLKKVEFIKNIAATCNPELMISVDGGVDEISSRDVARAGANMLVAGSYIFSDSRGLSDYSRKIEFLKDSNV